MKEGEREECTLPAAHKTSHGVSIINTKTAKAIKIKTHGVWSHNGRRNG